MDARHKKLYQTFGGVLLLAVFLWICKNMVDFWYGIFRQNLIVREDTNHGYSI